MRIQPPPLNIEDDEGFDGGKDTFGLKWLGEGLTNLIAEVEDPLVIAFNAQWGSGKTVFLRQWAGELRKANYPVIYFDAFENDYIEDAFAALAREIIGLVEAKTGILDQAIEGFKDKAIGLGKLLIKGGARIATKVAVRAATAGLANDKNFSDAVSEAAEESGDLAAQYLEDILSEPKRQKETIETFRKALSDLPGLLASPKDGEPQKPLVFIIDELDRCKPHFALELLERVKHFMSVPNVHFVLGVHLTQLRNSVKAAYGSEIDATAYLQKFINLTITHADIGRHQHERRANKYIQYLQKKLISSSDSAHDVELAFEFLQRVAEYRSMSLRTIERVFSHIAVCIAFTTKNHLRLGPIIGGLCILKVIEPELFALAKTGQLKYKDVEALFGFDADDSEQDQNSLKWQRDWWRYCLLDELPPELEDYGKSLFKYDVFGDRRTVLPLIANFTVDSLKLS